MSDHTHEPAADDALGPIDYLVIELPAGHVAGAAFAELLALVHRGVIGVLDLEFVEHAADGTVRTLAAHDVPVSDGVDLADLDGAASGLLDAEDVAAAAASIEPGSIAAVLVYENLWAGPFVTALGAGGARLVGDGSVALSEMLEALDRTEPAGS